MKNNMKKVLSMFLAILMMASLGATAFAMELPETTATTLKGSDKFYYTVTKEDIYTNVSGVKLTWTVPVVKYEDNIVTQWNTSTLKWEKDEQTGTTNNEVTFTLVNRGSYAVKAHVDYASAVTDASSVAFGKEVVDETTDPKGTKTINTNDPILASIVNDDYSLKETDTAKQEAYLASNCAATITGTVTLDPDKLTADSGKLGTYTVTISEATAAKLITVTVYYYENSTAQAETEETISVTIGTKYKVDENKIKIGETEYQTADPNNDKNAFTKWQYAKQGDYENLTYLTSGDEGTITADCIFAPYYGD